MSDDIKQFFAVIFFIFLGYGFFTGIFNHWTGIISNGSGCKYKAVIHFNPGRIGICELLRQRWDIPKDNKLK